MSRLSNYAENLLINCLLRGSTFTTIPTVYCALYITDPADTDTGTEVTGGSYVRQSVTFGAPADGVSQNTNEITFPTCTADWGAISHAGIRDNLNAGNLLFHGPLTTPKTVTAGDVFKFQIGNIVCSLA